MIKFFRNIRQSLLNEDKTRRYLKYAIGEIILVVIGILVALQINNWNEQRKRIQLEKVLLGQLKEEMLVVYGDIYGDYEILLQGNKSHFHILDFLNDSIPYNDSLTFDFHFIKMDEYIYPKEAVYERIKQEGLDIIRNDTIRSIIQDLYEASFPRLSKNNSFNPNISEVFDSYYLEHFKLNTNYKLQFIREFENDSVGGKIFQREIFYPREATIDGVKRKFTIGYTPLNIEELKMDTKFKILLDQTSKYRNYKRFRYQSVKVLIKELINLIDKELNSYE